ncbi:hypothetical protein ACHAWO_003518 [Cyclotella atomus]|uniref:Trigger factor ribosome-binding bacterial domain-containing protein n=1 Tax=Cyclotella atomus TaxID=382360 RepID=A0ABD3MP38_9STRA
MKLSIILTAGILATASAFVPTPSIYTVHTSVYATTEVELVAEPEGGTELTAVSSSLPGSRMKDMGPVEDGEDGVHSFWLSAIADGKKIKEFRAQTEKEASKKANFPGFRKGQIPPYAMPRMTAFAIQEAVIKTCEQSLEAYGLESLQGSAGEVTVHEDMQKISKSYKLGNDIPFTATYKGKFDAAVQSSETGGEDVVVDVEAEAVSE